MRLRTEQLALFPLLSTAYRPRHWSGDPDACGEHCRGPHHGDHLEADAVCPRCGGNALACFNGTMGQGCAYPW